MEYFDFTIYFFSSPCSDDNGGCQHLCLPSGFQDFRCECSVGYSKLDLQSGKCQINRSHPDSVLFTTNYGLEIVSRIKPMQTQIFRPISKMERPQSFDYYHEKQLMFWIDNPTRSKIFKMKRDGTEKEIILDDLQNAQNVALDWVSERIYWTDSKTKVIESSGNILISRKKNSIFFIEYFDFTIFFPRQISMARKDLF